MGIRRTAKTFGKFFIGLEQEDKRIMEQPILIVDNGYSRFVDLDTAIEIIQNYFPKVEIAVLTLDETRRSHLQKKFSTLKFILPSRTLGPKRYQIALRMLMMRKKRYDFIMLFSLDITPLVTSLVFLKPKKVLLYNQWGQWWSLRLRNLSEVFKITYIVKKKTSPSFKNLIKTIGLFLVLPQYEDEEILKYSILIVDDGHASFEQIDYAIQRVRESLPLAEISVLALEQRKALMEDFRGLKFIKAGECIVEKYRVARHMLRLRNNRYDYIILLSLDVTPIIMSILFMHSKALLNNRYHQVWILKPKSARGYLMLIHKFILNIIFNIIIFIYLLISVSWIFFKRSFNIFKSNILGKKD